MQIQIQIQLYNYTNCCDISRMGTLPCQAPCRRGRACRGFHNKASPDHDVDNDDDDDDHDDVCRNVSP